MFRIICDKHFAFCRFNQLAGSFVVRPIRRHRQDLTVHHTFVRIDFFTVFKKRSEAAINNNRMRMAQLNQPLIIA